MVGMSDGLVSDFQIVGFRGSWNGHAPLMRAEPILIDKHGEYSLVQKYYGKGRVVSQDISQRGMYGRVLYGEASWLDAPIPLVDYADVWLLRPSFPFRESAVEDLVECYSRQHGPCTRNDVVWAVMRMDSVAEYLLIDWCKQAAKEAVDCCVNNDLQRAHQCASVSFSICNTPHRKGLYLAVLELSSKTDWHDKTLANIRKEKGPEFTQECLTCKSDILNEIKARQTRS